MKKTMQAMAVAVLGMALSGAVGADGGHVVLWRMCWNPGAPPERPLISLLDARVQASRIQAKVYVRPGFNGYVGVVRKDGSASAGWRVIHALPAITTGESWVSTHDEMADGEYYVAVYREFAGEHIFGCQHRHVRVGSAPPPEPPTPPEPEPPEPEPPVSCPDVSPFGKRWLVPLFGDTAKLRVTNGEGDTSIDVCAYDVNGDRVACLLNEALDAHEIGRWDRSSFPEHDVVGPWTLRITARVSEGSDGVFVTVLTKPGGGGITLLPAVRTDR